jgi:hypothetical protein
VACEPPQVMWGGRKPPPPQKGVAAFSFSFLFLLFYFFFSLLNILVLIFFINKFKPKFFIIMFDQLRAFLSFNQN